MITQEKIDRINLLARKSRSESLTEAEKDEQRKLRAEYIEAFKQSLVSQLENTTIIEPDGTRRKVRRRNEDTSERRGNGIKQ